MMMVPLASARADDEEPEAAEPEGAADIYRLVSLPPFFERRIESILQDEQQQARDNAEKVGLRRMSRGRYRRALVALARRSDAKIRKLIGARRFAAWERVRAEEARKAATSASAGATASWPRDRCAAVRRLLRGATLDTMSAEQAHVWIHSHARHC
jgi:hypothetical protein